MSDIVIELDESAKRQFALAPDYISQCLEYMAAREIEALRQRVKGYEEADESSKELVRKLDILLNGEAGAAKQASLCDIVSQLATLKQAQEPVAEVIAIDGSGKSCVINKVLPANTKLYTSAPTIPAGWQIVPVDPTDDMQEAGCDVDCPQDGAPAPWNVYKAMLSAAPKPGEPVTWERNVYTPLTTAAEASGAVIKGDE